MLPALSSLPLPRALVFHVAGLCVIAGLGVSVYADSQRAADRMLALRQGGPDAVAIETFDAARHAGPAGEVTIMAQVDMSLPLQLVHRQGTRLTRTLAYPLAAVGAKGDGAPILGFFHHNGQMAEAEVLDFARIMPGFEKVGAVGPIVALNGELVASRDVRDSVAVLLDAAGRRVAGPLLGIAPYPEGRAAALTAPRPVPFRWVGVVVAVALLGGGLTMSRLHLVLAERRRLARIARTGRKRSGVAPEMATQKGRNRLAPLAPQPQIAPGPALPDPRPLTALVLRGWDRARRVRSRR